ncbi:DNA repair protein RAD50 [Cataglyphis hispanica]|uniref:DNA repair protein RAD50 n=1 Tax=Cataglyphis hispanica TaxID=1086592 RepID=UPI00217F364B|nr:DNA repair protein RAD50 [Cataglyphis hispanica]XP_050464675.1 DNA repair protein RAD50 [Cataglyphis hispanica]XP_050464676.1 DNA repair protein RAD50 [Cataglyphis hispanica]XP_050464677.1 DNA repair protein RAD50 [Cataglyphis hispanica]XP_050464678.1 DNA repair protein RAD50 [Cataglyphis hispanica]XP_050464680.1 DNA repair protein RAD50 [Cataglyphis hispanica]XP_050464681.1 DNA repair protein RAD50 [Cataglyphis hispanica]
MSKIRRLSLRGIRNFGDDNEDSLIRFSCPLTLILGPNGTGKTTIIEALKYATTGEFPPGSDKGKSFIHDPMLATTGSVRGVVKAEIIDFMGNTYTVSRTIESLKAVKKFKTLDSTVTRVSKDKSKKTSITNRCADVDAELSVALGVSKSILNYVIFCHQDELNWPFDQGKALKERFDEIFDSTKFNKALETISKLYKELQGDIRTLNAEKQTFKVLVSEVVDKETKLEEHKKRLDTTKEKIIDIDKQLTPLKQKIEEVQQSHSEYKNIQAEEEKKKMEYDVHKERYQKLKETIKNIFEGTTEQLNARIESYDTILKEKNNEIVENENEIKGISEKEARISKILAIRRETVGTFKQQVKDHEKRIVRRNHLLNDALQAWDFDTVQEDVTEIEVKAFTKRFEQKMRTLEREVEENRLAMQKKERESQKEVDLLRSNYSKIESEKILKEKEITEIRDEIVTIRNQIAQIDAAGNKLKSIEQKLQAAKQKTDELNNALDVNSVKVDIENKVKSRDKIETSLSAIDDEISSLHKLSSLKTEFDLKRSALQAKEEELENLKKKHGDSIKTLLNTHELQQKKLKTTLERVHQQLENETSSLTREIQTQERKTTAFQTTLQYIESDIVRKRLELQCDKEKISTVCDYKEFDETLLMQSKIVKDLQDKRGIYAYQATAYKEYIKKLSVKDPCCPLCHRNFQKQDKVADLIKEMENDIISNQPHRLKMCEEELKIQQEKYDNMLQLKPIVEKVIQCEENDLKKLEERLEKTKNSVKLSKIAIKDLEMSKAEPEKKLLLYKDMIGDIKFWDRCIDEIQQLKKTVDNLETQMGNAGVKRTIEELQMQRESLKTSFRETRNHIEALQLRLNKHNERLHEARETYNKLHEEQLKIHSDMQKLKHLKDKQEDLYTREVTVGEKVEKLREDLADAENQLDSGTQELEKIKLKNWQKQEADRKSMMESAKRLSDLLKIIDEVDSFISSDVPRKLANYESEIETYQQSLMELMNKRKDIEQAINKLKEDVASEEIGKRELHDNITLRKTKDMIIALKEQYQKLNEKLKNMNYNELTKKWDQLENEKQALLRQRNVALGNQEELERVIKQYMQELRKEEYRLARRNYTNKSIELTVQEDAIANLKAYSKILDTAMIEYHEERMSTVNKIMKKLWKHVYKGTDTSSIEICTEPTEGVGSNRRSYNYKLIQTKHGCKMDMKGRCSAGQKVLASIIIRLALAETFCKDCGILALDEPTTNLDEENANSLADTLTKVVELRSRYQKNFQLIIISHDEKFLQKLADLNNHKQFHELYRKQNGMTAVKISDFNEPTNSMVQIKSEDESDEEERHPNQFSTSDLSDKSSRKRYNWDDFNEHDRPPTKKRYRFAE